MKYDFLIVGSGLFGATVAHEMTKKGKRCLVIDKRKNIGGNVYTEEVEGINVHRFGAHIFHTSDERSGSTSTTSFRSTTLSIRLSPTTMGKDIIFRST